jgi:hypothetical protein
MSASSLSFLLVIEARRPSFCNPREAMGAVQVFVLQARIAGANNKAGRIWMMTPGQTCDHVIKPSQGEQRP